MGPESALPCSPEFETPEQYVDSLLDFIASSELLHALCGGVHVLDFFTRKPDLYTLEITHLVDFGAGQNYLGRALASEPYNKHIIALESRAHNIEGARNWDVLAKLAPKQQTMVNKKEWRLQQQALAEQGISEKETQKQDLKGERGFHAEAPAEEQKPAQATLKISNSGVGSIQYVEHYIKDGDLSRVVPQIVDQDAIREKVTSDLETATTEAPPSKQIPDNFVEGNLQMDDSIKAQDPRLLIISLHSCGNLVHHGIRSLLLNPSVSAVALVGGKGVRLNITARMMAVQAPQNWGKKDSQDFFKRHFYRALLQRIFMDKGIVPAPEPADVQNNNGSPLGWSAGGGTAPIILGSLRKSCYESFTSYVRGALEKLINDPTRGSLFAEKMSTMTDEEISQYETDFKERGKELSVMWSLMAFSAGVIEAAIVVDRWLFLKEQDEVSDAWVEPVFEFKHSPRNLVVVGIKK
ncbi:hypothetical protein E4T50_02698 [Aureobasidium sp. EXF-12298]|nr:hypothetical protein E4T50_02698 [Aureobasidium sp. EXF-12298]KAI4752033.1 hypothetical protein E4T51_14791 [Aureobasidium sp. EXF-12344]KAI4782054.1 hypothetical protein E4T52_03064 [Aureobasidium sp. EXF-3400]